MLQIANIKKDIIDTEKYGGKASGLSLLIEHGLNVPDCLAIQATDNPDDIDDEVFQDKLKNDLSIFCKEGRYRVAVRSSCTIEDGFLDSMAGHFSTFIGNMSFDEVLDNIKSVISGVINGNISDEKMGVVIQKKIKADFAGVLFSSDPISYRKNQIIVTYTEGLGDKLVSGEVSGTDIVISVRDGNYILDEGECANCVMEKSLKDAIYRLAAESKELEKKLGYPLDIEWAVSNRELFFLQCRPLTSITSVATQLVKVNEQNLSSLPSQLVSHDKIGLRLMAQKENIFISDAFAYVKNTCSSANASLALSQSEFCKGYSAVIIYPKRVSDKVVRSFVGDKMKVFGCVTDCCRYGIRSYPDYENLDACLTGFSEKLNDEYWISTTIIQEIFDPLYTGVMQRIPEGFLIEITRGHFLTKGVVPTSQYMVSNTGKVLERDEVCQDEWLKIIEGHVITCTCDNYEDLLVTLSDAELCKVVNSFQPVLKSDTNVVEFGVLKEDSGDVIPYLIDFVDDNSPIDISGDDIKSGIISYGAISGKPIIIEGSGKDSLNEHFHNASVDAEKSDEKVVFICKNPELALLSMVEQYKPENVGFVFRKCAVGAHLAVVLREKRIPAIKIDEPYGWLPDDCVCSIDAKSPGLKPSERIQFQKDGVIIDV